MVKNRRKNGDHYWVMANATPMMDGERITGFRQAAGRRDWLTDARRNGMLDACRRPIIQARSAPAGARVVRVKTDFEVKIA